jgi:chemotaxis protein methyltransferase CheR
VTDADCIAFLQWALPRLGMRWQGFRKVRRQVCRRIDRRLSELGIRDLPAYRAYLEARPDEWRHLDGMCRVTISRFYRDAGVFDFLRTAVLPALARDAQARGAALEAWSAGAASGEEAYTLALMWRLAVGPSFPLVSLHVLATDIDETMLDRARAAEYPESALRDLPLPWREAGFSRHGSVFRLRAEFRQSVTLRRHDVREPPPSGPFDLVLCRNVAFTYFDHELQRRVAEQLAACLRPGGALVVGAHERLPEGLGDLAAWSASLGVFRRAPDCGKSTMGSGTCRTTGRLSAETLVPPAPEVRNHDDEESAPARPGRKGATPSRRRPAGAGDSPRLPLRRVRVRSRRRYASTALPHVGQHEVD